MKLMETSSSFDRSIRRMKHSPADEELQELIFADKIRRARETPIEERLIEGARLFDINAEIMKGAIQSQFPEFSSEQIELEYFRRLQIARMIVEAGFFRDVGFIDE